MAEAFRHEVSAHEEMNDLHDNIVRMICAFQQDGNYCLVFELADGGNLQQLQDKHIDSQLSSSDPPKTRELLYDVLQQVYGLAGATKEMHGIAEARARRSSSPGRGPNSAPADYSGESADESSVAGTSNIGFPASSNAIDDKDAGQRLTVPSIDVTGPEEDAGRAIETKVSDMEGGPMPGIQHQSTVLFGPNTDENWRHGDIKPANILVFAVAGLLCGKWKLADFGRAKRNTLRTELRRTHETELFRTKAFEPPDLYVPEGHSVLISRRFDIWSLGCVYLGLITSLLYGTKVQQDFMNSDPPAGIAIGTPYWRKDSKESITAKVSESAIMLMNHITEMDPEKDGLIGDLVRLVKEKMLQLLPDQTTDRSKQGKRATAADVVKELSKIIDKANHPTTGDEYVFSGKNRSHIKPPPFEQLAMLVAPSSTHLSVNDAHRQPTIKMATGLATRIQKDSDYTNSIGNEWKYERQESKLYSRIRRQLREKVAAQDSTPDCMRCKGIDFSAARILFKLNETGENYCSVCTVITNAFKGIAISSDGTVELTKTANGYTLDGTTMLVLRVYDDSSKF